MYKKHQSRVRKFMANKSFIFFTGLLSLSVIDNAYGDTHTYVSVKNMIPSSQPHYSKKGYTIKADGKGHCMVGVYNPTSCTAIYGAPYVKIGVHYRDSPPHHCWGLGSYQYFKVINNDTGKIVGRFKSYESEGGYLEISTNPDNFMVNATGLKTNVNNKLNLRAGLYKGNNVE